MSDSFSFHDPKTDRDYVVEYDRDSVRFAESNGVNVAVLADRRRVRNYDVQVASLMSGLFYAGLVKHQPDVTQEDADDIWSRVSHKEDVFAAMLEMFGEPYAALLAEPEDGDPKDEVVIRLPKRAASAKAARA